MWDPTTPDGKSQSRDSDTSISDSYRSGGMADATKIHRYFGRVGRSIHLLFRRRLAAAADNMKPLCFEFIVGRSTYRS